jgi:hypothetical protein
VTAPLAICVLAYCLIAEGHARQCVLDPSVKDAVVRVERPLNFPQMEGLGPGFTSIEHRACVRLANDLPTPINYRRVDLHVRRQKHEQTPRSIASKGTRQ